MGLRSWFVRRLVKRVSVEVVAISQTEKKCLAFRGSLQATALSNIGNIHAARGELDEALKRMSDALVIAREIGNRQAEANQLCSIGHVYFDKGELDEALKYLKDALAILEKYNLIQGRDTIENAISIISKKSRNEL